MRSLAGALLAVFLCGASSSGAQDQKPWEALGISKEKYDAVVDYAGALSAHAYFVGACERFYDPASTAAAVASMTGVGEGEQGPLEKMLSRLWTQSYAEGRLKAKEFDRERCRKAILESDADAAATKAALNLP